MKMNRGEWLLQAILLLYSINVVIAGSHRVESIIEYNSGTLVGAAITNNTKRIKALLGRMRMEKRAAAKVVEALGQAKWYGHMEANDVLSAWLRQAKEAGVRIPPEESRIAPRSLLGDKCLCGYLEGNGGHGGKHGCVSGMHKKTSLDRALMMRVRDDDYLGMKEFLDDLRVTPSTIDAVKRAVKEARRLGASETLFELDDWLMIHAEQPIKRQPSTRTYDNDQIGRQDYDQSRPYQNSVDQPQDDDYQAVPSSQNVVNSSTQSSMPTDSLDAPNPQISHEPVQNVTEASCTSASTSICDKAAQPIREDPKEGQPQDHHALHSPPPSSAMPVRSILKPTKRVPAQLSLGLQETLRDIVRCPHCGGPMSQNKYQDVDDTSIRFVSMRQIDPRGELVPKVTTSAPSDVAECKKTCHSIASSSSSTSQAYSSSKSSLMDSQGLQSPFTSTSQTSFTQRSFTDSQGLQSSSNSQTSFSFSSRLPSTRNRPVIDNDWIRRNTQSTLESPDNVKHPEYGRRKEHPRHESGIQDDYQLFSSQRRMTTTTSSALPSTITLSKENVVKVETSSSGLPSSSSQDQTLLTQQSTISPVTDPSCTSKHPSMTQHPPPTDSQSQGSGIPRDGSITLKGDSSLDSSRNCNLASSASITQTTSTNQSQVVMNSQLAELQALVCDPHKETELIEKLKVAPYELILQASTHFTCGPDIFSPINTSSHSQNPSERLSNIVGDPCRTSPSG